MGTNFYYKIPIKPREVKKLRDAIKPIMDFDDFRDLFNAIIEGHVIHLGKRSAGWQFLWNFNNGKYFEANLQSIKDFLKDGGGFIEDEYSETFTLEEFFEDEIKACLYKDEDHCDMTSYHIKYPNEPIYCDPTGYEFQSDGLRFSKFTEFS